MPPAGEALDDDYVIGLLKKDATANQKRYLTNGLGSLVSKKPRGNAPKPNTRFLKNIIRETDSHNAALKAKEEEEAKARLANLKPEQRGTKRRREDGAEDSSSKRKRGDEKPGRWANALGSLGQTNDRVKERRRTDDDARRKTRTPAGGKHTRSHKRGDARDDLKDSPDEERGSARKSRSGDSRPPSHRKEHKRRGSSPPSSHLSAATRENGRSKVAGSTSESDPLEDLLGPKPASQSRARGRGADKQSTMDSRFNSSYDPKNDVDLEPEDDRDDWDMALEALRDRTKWRTQGADRLRAAGFTAEEVNKWEKGGEKDIEDVRWRKEGEGREWDRGKVADEDGDVGVKVEWGRLKGT